MMGIHLPSIISGVKQRLRKTSEVPTGRVTAYVGDQKQKKRFVVPILCLNHPSFRELLKRSEEEFGFNHPMGCLTIPCKEEAFVDLISSSLHSK